MKKHLKGQPIFQLIDRNKFNALVKKWDMDKWVQSFSTWEMTQALICCFVMRIESFREVEATLKIPDSTFGDSLRGRSHGFFQELCDLILLEIRAKTECHKNKTGVLYNGPYKPTNKKDRKKDIKLRHVIYRDPTSQKIFHFICSDSKISGQSIADIYKRRWAVELLFRWLKGHLNIRRLPTKTPNSIKTQLAVAVLVQLLLQLKKILDQFNGTLWELLRSIRTGLNYKILTASGAPPGCRWNPSPEASLTS